MENSGDVRSFVEIQWNKFIDNTSDDYFIHFVIGLPILLTTVHWIYVGFFASLDVIAKHTSLKKYKIQTQANEKLDWKTRRKIIQNVLFNQTIVLIPSACIGYFLMKFRGLRDVREVPTLPKLILDLIVSELFWEIFNYYTHRAFHSKYLYKYFHKTHHEFTAPISLVAQYSHPFNYVFSDISSPFSGSFVMGSHMFTMYVFTVIGVFQSCLIHCGFRIPFVTIIDFHDYHHYRFNECFGILGILDWIHGTDKTAATNCDLSVQYHSKWKYIKTSIKKIKML